MNFAQLLAARLTPSEKILLRLTSSEDAIIGQYHRYRAELSGGNLRGGTEAEGIEEMKEVSRLVHEEFTANSAVYA